MGISDQNRQVVANELSKLLADEFILYAKTRNAHWHVEVVDFHTGPAVIKKHLGF